MRALVVDDLLIARRLIVNNLKGLGFDEIIEKQDGAEAIEFLNSDTDDPETEKLDLIVTDWLMPYVDGLQLLNELRGMEQYKETPVLMITSVDEKQDVVKALKEGITDYIAKPYTPETLKNKVEHVLGLRDDYLLK